MLIQTSIYKPDRLKSQTKGTVHCFCSTEGVKAIRQKPTTYLSPDSRLPSNYRTWLLKNKCIQFFYQVLFCLTNQLTASKLPVRHWCTSKRKRIRSGERIIQVVGSWKKLRLPVQYSKLNRLRTSSTPRPLPRWFRVSKEISLKIV